MVIEKTLVISTNLTNPKSVSEPENLSWIFFRACYTPTYAVTLLLRAFFLFGARCSETVTLTWKKAMVFQDFLVFDGKPQLAQLRTLW